MIKQNLTDKNVTTIVVVKRIVTVATIDPIMRNAAAKATKN
jgi:hypothetical protein